MSEGLIINPGFFVYYATITVTYPSGSTLTCTCGSDSFTAETTSGSYTFVVPYAATWTVRATQGSQSKSANVSVTTYNQAASVTLSYQYYIIQNGALVNSFTFPNTLRVDYGQYKSTVDGAYEFRNAANYSTGSSTNGFDVTNYSTLKCDFYSANPNKLGIGICLTKTVNSASEALMNSNATYKATDQYTARHTISCDIASATGGWMIGVLTNTDVGGAKIAVYNMWLE